MALTITLGDIELKDISSFHSQSSAYDVVNKNFQKIKQNLDYLSLIPVEGLNLINFPQIPVNGTDYVLSFDGSKYNVSPMKLQNKGTKWKINQNETITIDPEYQYLLHNRIDIEGTVNIDGELVIL